MNSNSSKPIVINPLALAPTIARTFFWFALDLSLTLIIYFIILLATTNLQPRLPILFVTFICVTAVIELFHYTIGSSGAAFRYAIQWRYKANVIKARLVPYIINLNVIFIVVTLALAGASAYYFYQGVLYSPFDNKPEFAVNLFTSILTIVFSAVAIFITGAVVIVQLISGPYSSQFTRVFFRQKIFVFSLVSFIAIAIINLVLLRVGWNEEITTGTLLLGVYVIADIIILVYLLVQFADIGNTIRAYGHEVRGYIKKHLKEPLPVAKLPSYAEGAAQPTIPLQYKIKFAIDLYIIGKRIQTSPFQIGVPKAFTDELIEKSRPLLSSCLHAIDQDKRDITETCLSEIVHTTQQYLSSRKQYAATRDEFLMFLAGQLDVLYTAALRNRNEQYTSDLAKAAGIIGRSCLILTETQLRAYENGPVRMWIDFLAKASLRAYPLDHTNAPIVSIEAVIQIGQGLLYQGDFTTVLHAISDRLTEIGKAMGTQKGSWPASIAASTVHGQMQLLRQCCVLVVEKSYYQEYAIKHLCENITMILVSSYGSERDFYNIHIISAPVVGTIWQEGNISSVFSVAIKLTVRVIE